MAKGGSAALATAHRLAQSFLGGLDERGVCASASLAELRARLGTALPDAGAQPADVVRGLHDAVEQGLLASAGGRFFAWVIGGGLESAVAADWLCAVWDQNAALAPCSPSAAVVEEIAGSWLKDLLQLPAGASFAFTSGCQMAHFTALAAARDAVLRVQGWDVMRDGLFGAPLGRVLVGAERHGSVDRALRFLGFGARQVEVVPRDGHGRVQTRAMLARIAEAKSPTIIVLTAADLNVAAFDEFEAVIPFAKEHGAWVHVDGAFGLFAKASAKFRHLAAGVEHADSWATDCHKWLNVPFDSGFVAIRDKEAHRRCMSIAADYIATDKTARDQIDWNPEWSRRARGFAVYAALKELGRRGVERLVDRCCAHARELVDRVSTIPGAVVVQRPRLNQGLLGFRRSAARHDDLDPEYTERIREHVNTSGEAFFSSTVWMGKPAMRVSVVNWRTDERDISRAVQAIEQAVQECR